MLSPEEKRISSLRQIQGERHRRPGLGKRVEAGVESISAVFPESDCTMQANWNRSGRGE